MSDDGGWGDEVTISQSGSVHTGNVVGFWQELLSVDLGLGEANVSGNFGSGTTNHTKTFQGEYGLTQDGIVGPQTWNVARYLAGTTISSTPCTGCYYAFEGTNDLTIYWNSGSGGTWKWGGTCKGHAASVPGDLTLTDYPTANFGVDC